MALEHEIKQEKFANEQEKMAVNVLYTGSWLHKLNLTRLKPYGITPEQFNVLRILRRTWPKPAMLTDISDRMIDKSSNATRLVEKLRLKGLLKREVCPENRRQVDILVTEKGLSLLRKIDENSDNWMRMLKSIKKSEAMEINRILDKLRHQK